MGRDDLDAMSIVTDDPVEEREEGFSVYPTSVALCLSVTVLLYSNVMRIITGSFNYLQVTERERALAEKIISIFSRSKLVGQWDARIDLDSKHCVYLNGKLNMREKKLSEKSGATDPASAEPPRCRFDGGQRRCRMVEPGAPIQRARSGRGTARRSRCSKR